MGVDVFLSLATPLVCPVPVNTHLGIALTARKTLSETLEVRAVCVSVRRPNQTLACVAGQITPITTAVALFIVVVPPWARALVCCPNSKEQHKKHPFCFEIEIFLFLSSGRRHVQLFSRYFCGSLSNPFSFVWDWFRTTNQPVAFESQTSSNKKTMIKPLDEKKCTPQ